MSARVPRLESNYVSIYKLQPLYFVTGSFGQAFTMKGENFVEHIFVKCPKHKQRTFSTTKTEFERNFDMWRAKMGTKLYPSWHMWTLAVWIQIQNQMSPLLIICGLFPNYKDDERLKIGQWIGPDQGLGSWPCPNKRCPL